MLFAILSATLALLLDLLHAATRGEHDKALETVVLRQHLRLYERTAARQPLSWLLSSSAATTWHS